jgi:signal transduction histidine kinase
VGHNTTYAHRTGSAVGQMFFAGFGTLWMTGWCLQTHGVDWPMLGLIVLAGGTLFLWAMCDFRAFRPHVDMNAEPEARKARQRVFRWVNLMQWLAVFAVSFILSALGHPEWSTPAVVLIVGLHLIPLARIFHAPRHYVTGIALIVVALAYPWMNGGGPNYPSGEFATGAILWISALYTSLRGHLGKSSGGVVGRQGVLANEVR